MITATMHNNVLTTHGEVLPGDIYPGVCCAGYSWRVTTIRSNAWGICDNPDCPRHLGYIDPGELAEAICSTE